MILKKSHNEIDKKKWDACMDASQFPIVYGYSWYLDTVSPNWSALIVESENEYVSIFPLPEKKKFGFRYLAQPFFCQQLGLFHRKNTNPDLESFIKKIQKTYTHHEITLNESNTLLTQKSDRTNLILDLNQNYKTIEAGYSTNRKRDIKKTQKGNISISESEQIEKFIHFFWEEKGNNIEDLTRKDYNLIVDIFNNGKHETINKLILGHNEKGILVSASYFILKNKRIIFLLGTSNMEGKKKGVMTSIFDSVIREYSNQDLTLDFEGSNIKGVAKFYKSLGGKEKKYISLKGNSFLWGAIAPKIARLIQR